MNIGNRMIICLAALLLAGGCSQKAVQENTGFHTVAPDGGQLPALDELRTPSQLLEQELTGKDYSSISATATAVGNKLYVFSDPGQLCWGLWSFKQGLAYLESIEIAVTAQPGNPWWLALSDYQSGRWEISGPFEGGMNVELAERHASPDGGFHCAVLTYDLSYVEVDSLTLHADDGWNIVELPNSLALAQQGEGPMLDAMLLGGKPVAAVGNLTGGITFTYPDDTLGAGADDWNRLSIVGSGNFQNVSIAEIDGHPAVCAMRSGSKKLLYFRSQSPEGTLYWEENAIDSDYSGTFAQPSLLEVDGAPAVAFHSEHGDLFYQRASNSTGIGMDVWGQPEAVHSPGGITGIAPELMVVDGHPAIAFYSVFDKLGIYMRSSNQTGTGPGAWGGDPLYLGPYYTQLSPLELDGHPAIAAFETLGEASLHFLRASSPDGTQQTDWVLDRVVDEPLPNSNLSGVGQFPSMQSVDGVPAIAYRDLDQQTLKYAQALPAADGDYKDWHVMTVDDKFNVGQSARMLVLEDGSPAIFYLDNADKKIRYATRRKPQEF